MSEYIKSLTAEDDSTYLIKENPAIHYGTCSTAAATVAKTVDIDGFKLDTGSWIAIKFTVTNTGAAGSLTLNVNNTGAYSIKYRNGNLDDKGYLAANRIYLFLFDGTYWQIVGDIDAGHPVIVKSTDTTSTASPAYGGTFTAVDSVTRDDFGHVTKINTKTVTMPARPADNDTKNTAGSTDTSSKIYLVGATSQTTYAQTYSDDQCYVTSGTLQTNKVQATVTVSANTGNSNSAGGLSLYATDPETYGVMFRGTGNSGKHGYVQSDWATYFTMNSGATTRGWIFRRKGDGNYASISGAGHAVFNGSVTVGGNSTNTSGCRMEYNTTAQSLDFVFV